MIYYTLPEYPHHYSELVNSLSNQDDIANIKKQNSMGTERHQRDRIADAINGGKPNGKHVLGGADPVLSGTCSSLTLYTKLDKLALERTVGAKRAKHMVKSDKATFMFQ